MGTLSGSAHEDCICWIIIKVTSDRSAFMFCSLPRAFNRLGLLHLMTVQYRGGGGGGGDGGRANQRSILLIVMRAYFLSIPSRPLVRSIQYTAMLSNPQHDNCAEFILPLINTGQKKNWRRFLLHQADIKH